jgi:hypothetical protein
MAVQLLKNHKTSIRKARSIFLIMFIFVNIDAHILIQIRFNPNSMFFFSAMTTVWVAIYFHKFLFNCNPLELSFSVAPNV